MSHENFKDFIENRTVADIMEDYGEQRDEWQTLLVTDENGVKRFRHENGKDFFCEQYVQSDSDEEEYVISDEILKVLSGKTIEQQMAYYYVTESTTLSSRSYGEITREDLRENSVKLCDYNGVKTLIVKDRILIGARIEAYWGDGVLLPGRSVCTYYASDNNGSGYKEREDYTYLIFSDAVPEA